MEKGPGEEPWPWIEDYTTVHPGARARRAGGIRTPFSLSSWPPCLANFCHWPDLTGNKRAREHFGAAGLLGGQQEGGEGRRSLKGKWRKSIR